MNCWRLEEDEEDDEPEEDAPAAPAEVDPVSPPNLRISISVACDDVEGLLPPPLLAVFY